MFDDDPSTPPGIRRDASTEALVLANVALRLRYLANRIGEVAGKLDTVGAAERAYLLDDVSDALRDDGDIAHDAARACHVAARGYAPIPPGVPRYTQTKGSPVNDIVTKIKAMWHSRPLALILPAAALAYYWQTHGHHFPTIDEWIAGTTLLLTKWEKISGFVFGTAGQDPTPPVKP
jgi:hypothetical protein